MMAQIEYADVIGRILERNHWGTEGNLAKKLGISPNTWTAYKQGRQSFDLNDIAKICDLLGVTSQWLLYGEELVTLSQIQQVGSFQRGDLEDVPIRRLTDEEVRSGQVADGFILIPRLDIRASAGAGLVALQENEPAQVPFSRQLLARLGVNPKHAQFLIADGDSMWDTIADGDLMLIDRSIDQVRSEGVYVVTYFGEVKVKRVQLLRSGAILLKSDNPKYQTEEVPSHEVPDLQVEGRVRWVGGSI